MNAKRILALTALVLFAVLSLPVWAASDGQSEWRSDLKRVNDFSGVLSESDADELNSRACGDVESDRFDYVIMTYDNAVRGDETDEGYLRYLYEKNGLGWGVNRDGLFLGLNTDEKTALLISFGRGSQDLVRADLDAMLFCVQQGYEQGGYAQAIASYLTKAEQIVRDFTSAPSEVRESYAEGYVTDGPVGLTSSGLPDWYPADIASWTFTPASPDTPRVRDDADIFTAEEEAKLEERIAEVAPAHAADIVVFTDVTSHGMEHSVYAADYYDFGGFGYGPQHDGFCLLICMDPNDRGGWCCVTGAPRGLYTQENADALDDVLYEYLGDGRYFEGVYDWIGNIGTLLDKGIPFAPPWYPSIGEQTVRRHDPNAPRVVDDSGVLTAEQIASLSERAAALTEKYGVDVVIHTTPSDYGLGRSLYTDKFYNCCGYGLGDGFDGIILTLVTGGEESGQCVMTFGSGARNLSDSALSKLSKSIDGPAFADNWYGAADRWLKNLTHAYKTGRVPRTPGAWAISSVVSLIGSAIGSSASVGKAKRSMTTVRRAYSAGDYLQRDSLRFENGGDTLVNTSVTRVYSPIPRDTGRGSSSGGHSSHSSSYHGSSGTSHSGSGRKF